MISLFKKYLDKLKYVVLLIVFLVFIQSTLELFLPNIMAGIIDNGIVKKDMGFIKLEALRILIIISIALLVSGTAAFLASKVAIKFGQNVRRAVFTKVQTFSAKEFDKFGVASLVTRTTNDITQIQTTTLFILRMMILGPMTIISGLIIATYTDFKLSMILYVSIPILILFVVFIGFKTIRRFSEIQFRLDKVNLISRENLTGIRVIRAFNKQKYEEKRFDNANRNLTDFTIRTYKIFASLMPFMMLVFYLNSVAVLWFGSKRISTGNFMVGDLIAFIQYSNQIMVALITFFMLFGMIPKAISSAKRINQVLNTEVSINDLKEVKEIDKNQKASLKFKNVSLSYNDSNEYDVENIDFECKAGETVAIIGGTGSGKSTILNLISRFYDVSSGEIIFNGLNIKDITQKELREQIGYVPQKSVLFSGTIRSNLCYGKENVTDEELMEALKIAQAYEFVTNLERGLDSPVAQGGTNFSGGQKQRLSIARALVRKASIYLFDDSFSALDFKTDAKLRAALKEKITDAIIIIVGQRVSSIMNADKILVLDNGKVVGMGTHRELLQNCEVYQEIAKSQLSEEELA